VPVSIAGSYPIFSKPELDAVSGEITVYVARYDWKRQTSERTELDDLWRRVQEIVSMPAARQNRYKRTRLKASGVDVGKCPAGRSSCQV